MTYRIIIVISIIISLGQILLTYIAHAHTHTRTHARTHAHTHTHTRAHAHTYPPPSPFRLSLCDGSVALNHVGANIPFRRFRWRSMAGRCFGFLTCALCRYVLCMRTVCVQRARNTLGMRCQLASFSQILPKFGRTATHWSYFYFSMRGPCVAYV